MKKLTALTEALGYRFLDESLLRLALRHPSLGAENNQRLEFLGDAVLQLVISDRLFREFPGSHEGQLTALRQQLVCEQALAQIARELDLGAFLQMDHGCVINGLNRQDGALSDAMEAVLAAVYLDGGYAEASAVIERLWPDREAVSENAKSRLQELLQAEKKPVPDYQLISEEGPAHLRSFTVAAYLNGQEIGRGSGTSKKRAEQEAAGDALRRLYHEDQA